MSPNSGNNDSKMTDKHISEYNERLKKERDLTIFDSELKHKEQSNFSSPIEKHVNTISTWKSDFGRSLDQLERAFSAKRHELDSIDKKILEEKQELEKLYKFKVNVVNLNNVIRFLNEILKIKVISTLGEGLVHKFIF